MAEDLVGHEEVPDVGTRESPTGGAVAVLVQRPRVGAVFGALDVDAPVDCECGTVASHARRCDAVEQVHATANALDEVLGESNAHQITRPLAGQGVVQKLENAVHGGLRLPNRQTTDPEAAPISAVSDCPRCREPQLLMNAALDNREERLRMTALALAEPLELVYT